VVYSAIPYRDLVAGVCDLLAKNNDQMLNETCHPSLLETDQVLQPVVGIEADIMAKVRRGRKEK